MVFVRFHNLDNEIGHLLYVGEDVLNNFLHLTFKEALPVFADEYQMALEIPFVPSCRGIFVEGFIFQYSLIPSGISNMAFPSLSMKHVVA